MAGIGRANYDTPRHRGTEENREIHTEFVSVSRCLGVS